VSLPFARAGSALGPTRTKSLYITASASRRSLRPRISPPPALSWTNTTSASPAAPMSSAWPVPTATTRASMPVSLVNAGSRSLKSPDCTVEVVEATVTNGCALRRLGGEQHCRGGRGGEPRDGYAGAEGGGRLSHGNSPLRNRAASGEGGRLEELLGRRLLGEAPAHGGTRLRRPCGRAKPRLCVVITIPVPAAWISPTMRRLPPPPRDRRLAVGSSRKRSLGLSAHARASASALLLATRKARAWRAASGASPTRSRASDARASPRRAPRRSRRARTRCWLARFGAASPAAGRPSPWRARAARPSCPEDLALVGAMSPCSSRSSTALAGALGASTTLAAGGRA
jgi:hypothetical protein